MIEIWNVDVHNKKSFIVLLKVKKRAHLFQLVQLFHWLSYFQLVVLLNYWLQFFCLSLQWCAACQGCCLVAFALVLLMRGDKFKQTCGISYQGEIKSDCLGFFHWLMEQLGSLMPMYALRLDLLIHVVIWKKLKHTIL